MSEGIYGSFLFLCNTKGGQIINGLEATYRF